MSSQNFSPFSRSKESYCQVSSKIKIWCYSLRQVAWSRNIAASNRETWPLSLSFQVFSVRNFISRGRRAFQLNCRSAAASRGIQAKILEESFRFLPLEKSHWFEMSWGPLASIHSFVCSTMPYWKRMNKELGCKFYPRLREHTHHGQKDS